MGLCSCCSWACLRKWVEFYVLLFQASSPSLIPPERSSIPLLPSPVQLWMFAEGQGELLSCFKNFHALEPSEFQKCWNLKERSLWKASHGVNLERSDRGVMGRSWCLFPDTLSHWLRNSSVMGNKVFRRCWRYFDWSLYSAVRIYPQC